jgi:hypothetical protein
MTTQQRLDNYLAAEAAILEAQELRGGDRVYRMAELEEVRKGITQLQSQLAREQSAAASGGRRRFSHSVADLSRT